MGESGRALAVTSPAAAGEGLATGLAAGLVAGLDAAPGLGDELVAGDGRATSVGLATGSGVGAAAGWEHAVRVNAATTARLKRTGDCRCMRVRSCLSCELFSGG
jgi:hypothetical protein